MDFRQLEAKTGENSRADDVRDDDSAGCKKADAMA